MIERNRVAVIGAYTEKKWTYGLNDGMPWPRGSFRSDMKRFKSLTLDAPLGSKNILICGPKTCISMGMKPLADRLMIVVLRKPTKWYSTDSGVFATSSIEQALHLAGMLSIVHHAFLIGGEFIWSEGMKYASRAHITITGRETEESPGLVHLKRPLHEIACSLGMTLTQEERVGDETTWAPTNKFQTWSR